MKASDVDLDAIWAKYEPLYRPDRGLTTATVDLSLILNLTDLAIRQRAALIAAEARAQAAERELAERPSLSTVDNMTAALAGTNLRARFAEEDRDAAHQRAERLAAALRALGADKAQFGISEAYGACLYCGASTWRLNTSPPHRADCPILVIRAALAADTPTPAAEAGQKASG